MLANHIPNIGTKNYQGKFSASEILLMTNVLIGGKKNLEPGDFCRVKQIPVLDRG